MDATFLTTLRQLFPRVTLNPPNGETRRRSAPLSTWPCAIARSSSRSSKASSSASTRTHAVVARARRALAHGRSVLRRSRARATPARRAPRDAPRPPRRLEELRDHERSQPSTSLRRQRRELVAARAQGAPPRHRSRPQEEGAGDADRRSARGFARRAQRTERRSRAPWRDAARIAPPCSEKLQAERAQALAELRAKGEASVRGARRVCGRQGRRRRRERAARSRARARSSRRSAPSKRT